MTSTPVYPAARRGDTVDRYHGVEVPDPYRWLEDPDSAETRAWIDGQNRLTFSWLDQVEARPRIRERLTTLWDYDRYGVPFKEGGRLFFQHNPGLLNQSQLHVVDRDGAAPRLLLDPNTLSADGTVALTGLGVSRDGRRLAYALSSAGSDWQEWRVRDVDTGRDLPDEVRFSKFSGAAWTRDGSGFFYSAYDPPVAGADPHTASNFFHKLYFHRLGTPQSEDRLVYERPDHEDWGFHGEVTEDGRYLVIHVWEGTNRNNGLLYQRLDDESAPVVELLVGFDARYELVDNLGSVFLLKTDRGAPRGRLVAVNLRDPSPSRWREVIPEAAEALESVHLVGGHLLAEYLKDAHSVARVHDLDGTPIREVELPGIGSVGGVSGRHDDPETFFAYTSFTTPTTIYRYRVDSGQLAPFRRPSVPFDPAKYETRQVFFQSKDGTRVPMFITHRRDLPRGVPHPTYLYGYGGFNHPLTPAFNPANIVWMELGGIYAVANIRGGGEYGKAWHEAGMKLKRQNVFDDFIAAAEWLIDNRVTTPSRLAIGGRSNGGLLVGACMTQRPELFGAVLPGVGVLDMLRYHTWTIGWAWASDYGTVEDPAEFRALHAYSPYHNVTSGATYPATFITTADHDDRVVPAHSFKYAAMLQHAQGGPAPILIRIETRAGHGAGKPTQKQIEELADQWAFLVRVFEMPVSYE